MSKGNKIYKTFGANLKQARNALGISQEELAHEIGVDRTYISLLERGLRNPSLKIICMLGGKLNVTPASLLSGLN